MQQSEVARAAGTISLELRDLLPADAGQVGAQLDALLARARAGDDVDDDLMLLLTRFESTRQRLDELLPEADAAKGYADLPGHGEPIGALLYRCPRGDYEYPALEVGEPIPPCPVHHIALVLEA
jgi:hypothetical protein